MMFQKSADALAVHGHIFVDCGYTQYPEKWFNNPDANIVWEGTDSHGNFGKMILLESIYDTESRINRFIRRFEMILANGSTLVQEIPSEKHFATLEQIHKWLDEGGFETLGNIPSIVLIYLYDCYLNIELKYLRQIGY